MRNPHPEKKSGAIDTRIVCLRTCERVRLKSRDAADAVADKRPQPRAAPKRHHCRAHGPERHRRQDV